jgi:chemotaxis protein MotA
MRNLERTDVSTIGGIIVAAAGLFAGVRIEGIHLYEIAQLSPALVVLCGTVGAVSISTPLVQIKRALKILPAIFQNPLDRDNEIVEEVIKYARVARLKGLVSLEKEAPSISDPLLRKAMQLAVDAVDSGALESVLESEITGYTTEAEGAAAVYEVAAGYAPTLGIAGAAIGLVQVMKHLDHIDQVGAGVAAAFTATIYGVLLANLILLPIATKIRARAGFRIRTCSLVKEGVLSIVAGLNPTLIRLKLQGLAQMNEAKQSSAAVRIMPVKAS